MRREVRHLPPYPVWASESRLRLLASTLSQQKTYTYRGLAEAGALQRLVADVDWGALDVFFFDMRPGVDRLPDLEGSLTQLDVAIAVTISTEVSQLAVRRSLAKHNVHMMPHINEEFNKAMPARIRKMPVPGKMFSQPEVMVQFKCDVHPWMSAYLGVLPHPFFAVSEADGSFAIDDVPPGKYTVEAWHEFFQSHTQEIEVGEQPLTLSFALKLPAKK